MGQGESIKIIIATHKKYPMPKDEMYLPLHVGAEGKTDSWGRPLNLGYVKDNTGKNISQLNSTFCELTGLYWAWRNVKADYIGLVHYRRHFSMKKGKDAWERILEYSDIEPYLGKIKVFTPNKRKYYIETLYSHYAHTHYSEQLDETRKIIGEKYPEYAKCYDKVVKRTYGYMFNMMIMEKKMMNEYCEWLFDILFELRKRMNASEISALTAFQRRYFGRISEIIFNVWLERKLECGELKKSECMEILCIHMEKTNWWKKGRAFLGAKFMGWKYEGSF